MGQNDVLDWLRNKRELNFDNYYLPKEIAKGLKELGLSNGALWNTRGDCFRLWQQGNGCLEMFDFDKKGITNQLKAFRLKKEYCNNAGKNNIKG